MWQTDPINQVNNSLGYCGMLLPIFLVASYAIDYYRDGWMDNDDGTLLVYKNDAFKNDDDGAISIRLHCINKS